MKNRTRLSLVCCALVLGYASVGTPAFGEQKRATTSASDADIRKTDAQSEEAWAYSVGIQNYVFGLPLTIYERERALRLNPAALEKAKKVAPAAPLNQIGHMKTLATADDVMPYTPNNDTVYSGSLLDLRDGPVILTAPDISDRYWSVEVADAYTNNTFYIGTRATGGKGGNHAFVGPDWKGTLPAGVVEHRMPTNEIMFAIRIGVLPGDASDLKKVNALQEQFSLTSLKNWGDPSKHGMADVPTPKTRTVYSGNLAFYQTLADLLIENPPAKEDAAAVVLLHRGGIEVGQPLQVDQLSAPMKAGLARAAVDGPKIMKWKVKFRGTPYPTRWNNLRPGSYGVDYFDRAAGALEGLFVHDREEAEYFSTYESGDAQLLDGKNRYVLHFNKDELPPVADNGFWSITMYGSNFQLVKNPINRFSIGDRTPGLKKNDDGSLDIYIQHTAPAGKESNWLPSPPSGLFRLNYRIYLPQPQARDPKTLGKYLPPIKKVS
ncbi:signal peptide protein [Pandoraea pneumonica]|uniref:Signal peptide protein n=1 Tax=Pandoraea pneumonica TaxID=2508299 RepID=A0A5E4S0X3_9BURK|nr:signal peptide protein [Pandoraea pneumonica]